MRDIFGGGGREEAGPATPAVPAKPLYGLDPEERDRIGTQDDPLRDFEAAMQRNEEAEKAEQGGDPQRAIDLYEKSVAESFVGSHPYERLISIYERRRAYPDALRVCRAYLDLAASGRMPKGAQRRADRKIPEFEARVERYGRTP